MPNASPSMRTTVPTMTPPWKPPPDESAPWNITNSPNVKTNGVMIRTVVMMIGLSTYGLVDSSPATSPTPPMSPVSPTSPVVPASLIRTPPG
jgi:hypothetical protein